MNDSIVKLLIERLRSVHCFQMLILVCHVHCVPKNVSVLFFDNAVKHWPILIIFGTEFFGYMVYIPFMWSIFCLHLRVC